MDTVNTPVQKKPFPVAAITFSVSVFALLILLLLPITRNDAIAAVDVIMFFGAAIPLVFLVVGLFIRKNNLLVFIPLCVLALSYLASTVFEAVNGVVSLTYIFHVGFHASAGAFEDLWRVIADVGSNALVCLGFLLMAVITFGAQKFGKKITKLWFLPVIPFGLATVSTLFSFAYYEMQVFEFVFVRAIPMSTLMNTIAWSQAQKFSTLEIAFLLFTLSALFYGLALKKSAKI